MKRQIDMLRIILYATIVDITGANYPDDVEGHPILPMEGESLSDVFTDNEALDREAIYFEHGGNRAVRQGKWKLVSKTESRNWRFIRMDELPLEKWALYDLEKDRTETNNLADQYPEKVKKMAEQWQRWAERTHTIPKPK